MEHLRRIRLDTVPLVIRRDVGLLVWLRVVVLVSLPEEGLQDAEGGGSVEHSVIAVVVEVGDTDDAGEGMYIVGIF